MATQATSAAVVVQQQGGGDGGAMVAYTPAEAGGGQVRHTATHAVGLLVMGHGSWVMGVARQWVRPQVDNVGAGRDSQAAGTTGLFKSICFPHGALGPTIAHTRHDVVLQLSEWIEYWDDEAQSYYYYNPVTQEASWTPPQELSVVSSSGGMRRASAAN